MSVDNEDEIQFGHDEPEHEVHDEPEEEDSEPLEVEDSTHEEEVFSEENPDEQLSKERKKRDKAQARINQIQREKFQAINELEKLKAENELLKQDKDFSTQAAMRQYDANVASRLEKARAAQIAAIESGDAQAQADANIELASVTNELHELNNWKYKEEFNKRNTVQQQQHEGPVFNPYHSNDPVFQDWIEENEWFHPESKNHDPDLAAYIDAKSREIDQGLIQSGYGFKIRDEDYFREIDRLANEYANYRNQSAQRRDLNMKPVRGGASPVRGYSQGMQNSSQRRETLSPDEREMAKRMGVSDKVYLQYRLRDQQENGHRRRGGR